MNVQGPAATASHHSPRDCVLFSTADWSAPYWTNKQHVARTMSARGWRILYVESIGFRLPRARSGRDWSRLGQRLFAGLRCLVVGPRNVAPSIWVYSPLVIPGARSGWMLKLNSAIVDLVVRRFSRAKRFDRPTVWTYHPYILELNVVDQCGPLVYHCVDDLAAVPGIDADAIRVAEMALARQADLIFTTARHLSEKLHKLNPRTRFLPNVADAGHFGRALSRGPIPADLSAVPEPRLVYHGVLSDFKLDFDLLARVARARPMWQLVLIGDEREGQRSSALAALVSLANVHLLGYRPYDDLPDYLRGMAVGLLPLLNNAYTDSMYPMKFHEYLAAGLPVVATPAAFTSDSHSNMEVGEDADGFIRAIERQLARGRLTVAEADRAVGDNTWERRLDLMEEALAEVGIDGTGGPRR